MKKEIWGMGISGLGNHFHDNSICLIKNGKVFFATAEERYSRIKHDPSFPKSALKAALNYAGIKEKDIDFYASGWPKTSIVKTLLNTQGKIDIIVSVLNILRNAKVNSIPLFFNFFKAASAKPQINFNKKNHFVIDHYLAHASSAYRTSGFSDCLTVVWDGFGSKQDGSLASGGVFNCRDGKIEEIEVHPIESSIGLFYEAVTNALGFVPAEGEGKTTGLAAYGNPKRFLSKLREFAPKFQKGKWVKSDYWPDTLFSVDLKYKKVFDRTYMGCELSKLIKISNQDVAAACQFIVEEEASKYFDYLYKKYKKKNYSLAGGVFLNIKMNKKIRELPFVKQYYIHPNAGDGGLSMGAVLEVYSRKYENVNKALESAALGDEFKDVEIKRELLKTKGIIFEKRKDIEKYTAEKINQGRVIGWFQGRGEWGPRALGQRSVLADPRDERIKERINKYLKKRDWFMPFAPSVLEEDAEQLFINYTYAPFMTIAFDVVPAWKKAVKAATHIDGTCRPQIVSKKTNFKYWNVINEFNRLSGIPLILNTSFNRHGLPIVNSPKDALDHLLWGAIDELILGDYIVKRKDE